MNSKQYFISAVYFVVVLFCAPVMAQTSVDQTPNNGLNVSISIRHEVTIPQIIYFSIGSVSAISKVTINLNSAPSFSAGNNITNTSPSPLGNSVAVAATNNGVLAVSLRSNVGTVTLSYTVDNPSGLADGSGNFIGFDQINTSSDNSDLAAPLLINAASNTVNILGNFFSGRVIKRTANWTYSYKNETTPVAGTYNGRVTYIASAP